MNPKIRATIDATVAAITQRWGTNGQAVGDAFSLAMTETGITGEARDALWSRFEEYRTAAPWHRWPAQHHAQRLALLVAGLDDEDEADAEVDRYLVGIKTEMIIAGFCEQVADNWTCDIAGNAGAMECDISMAGGYQMGRA